MNNIYLIIHTYTYIYIYTLSHYEYTSMFSTFFLPKQVYLWGSILEKKRLDTLVGALCCVGRGFGSARRAGLVGRGIWPRWARWAGLGVGGLGVGFGRAGLGWAQIWLSVYGLRCTCLLHVFVMPLCLSSCVFQMCIMGLEQNKA